MRPGNAGRPELNFPEWRAFAEESLLGIDARALALEKIGDRLTEPGIGAGLHPPQPARDRDVDRLIIAKLEVQQRLVDGAAPVAPV